MWLRLLRICRGTPARPCWSFWNLSRSEPAAHPSWISACQSSTSFASMLRTTAATLVELRPVQSRLAILFISITDAAPRLPILTVQSLQSPLSRSEEHTSELQSRGHLVCRLLLEKKKKKEKIEQKTHNI